FDTHVVSTTTTGIPSSSSPSGYAWIYNTAGIQNGLIDVQSGGCQLDMTIAASSTAGVGRIWITVWQCGSSTLTSCTLLFTNWDTSTNNNVMSSTTPQKYTWMSAPQASFSSCNVKYLAVEYWLAIQFS